MHKKVLVRKRPHPRWKLKTVRPLLRKYLVAQAFIHCGQDGRAPGYAIIVVCELALMVSAQVSTRIQGSERLVKLFGQSRSAVLRAGLSGTGD